jgi:hypothetical protein
MLTNFGISFNSFKDGISEMVTAVLSFELLLGKRKVYLI